MPKLTRCVKDHQWIQWQARRTDSQDSCPIDLYWWWHDLTTFRVFQPAGGAYPHVMQFIAEGNVAKFCQCKDEIGAITVPSEYLRDLPQNAGLARYFTFNVDVPRLRPSFFAGVEGDPDSDALRRIVEKLITCKHLTRLQLGFPRGEDSPDSRKNDNDVSPTAAAQSRSPVVVKNADVVIGVIDNGAAFAHAAFRNAGGLGSRFEIIWNQTRQLSYLNFDEHTWTLSGAGWYGAVIDSTKIDRIMKRCARDDEIDELGCYGSLVSQKGSERAIRSRESHGASVAAAVAGSLDAANVIPTGADDCQQMRSPELADAAAKAPIIFVDMPNEQIEISSGRWMPVTVLDGVRFIVAEARKRFKPRDSQKRVPVVINISSGSSAGSHDGNSMIESALTEILNSDPLIAITVSAGNSRLTQSHFETILSPKASEDIYVRVPPAKRFETYVELWPAWQTADGKTALVSPDNLKIAIKSPAEETFRNVVVGGEEVVFLDGEGNVIAGIRFAKNAVQSRNRAMALLVISATSPHEIRPSAPYGNWVIRCTNNAGAPLKIQAWIERDEIVFGLRQPQQARFIDADYTPPQANNWIEDTKNSVSRYSTLSNLASASHAFAVAAGVGGEKTGFVSPYSGGGSGRSELDGSPLLMARADRSPAQPGMPAWGNYRSARRHMNGTSIAAPQAARWIANAFARGNDRHSVEVMAQFSQPRTHPHLNAVAAGEGRLFIEASDFLPLGCNGENKR